MTEMICTTCGRTHKAGHSSACNGPNQEIITREEYEARRKRAGSADPELLEVREPRPPERDRTLNIFQRINGIMSDVDSVQKGAQHAKMGYRYAGHEAVTAAVRGAYVRWGVVRTATVLEEGREGGLLRLKVRVSWINVDDPDDVHAVDVMGESPSTSSKNPDAPSATQFGVALSYAVKNAEFKVLSIVGDDTPDAEETDRGDERSRRQGEERLENAGPLLRRYETATSGHELEAAHKEAGELWSRFTRKQKEQISAAAEKAKERIRKARRAKAAQKQSGGEKASTEKVDEPTPLDISDLLGNFERASSKDQLSQASKVVADISEKLDEGQLDLLRSAAEAARARLNKTAQKSA